MTPFKLKPQRTVTRAAESASANVALLGAPSRGEFSVRLVVDGDATTFIEFGDSDAAATVAGSAPLLGDSVEVMTAPDGATHIAAVTSSGTATVYATVGDGA